MSELGSTAAASAARGPHWSGAAATPGQPAGTQVNAAYTHTGETPNIQHTQILKHCVSLPAFVPV